MSQHEDIRHAIVIGSGIGGLACAAALARSGKAVLVLEQQHTAGGLTQTFSRYGFQWDVGLHYLGEMGPDGDARAVIDWLTGGTMVFAPMGTVYDIIHFPGDFEVRFARPQAALQHELKAKFPDSANDIDAFFFRADRSGSRRQSPFYAKSDVGISWRRIWTLAPPRRSQMVGPQHCRGSRRSRP
ncbi:FAD-dependent oxidoreductase [Paraburkholderia sp. BL10I2N1]|uniref:FAD-dependent oxidoreductase n=1 Tax=Paraburkholderia sp. BL10I2N1 TaxID=1938796 RepID=UPI001060703B|nr:FAD-dependent oxidoreductase [Paraburkholderia sp. BL10I2N1]